MTTKLELYNGALREIGEPRLSALTDEGPGRRALDDIYDQAVLYCLEQGQWNFAVRAVELESEPSVETSFGYKYVFAKPDDWVRTVALSCDEYGRLPLVGYEDRGGYWLADNDPVWCWYVSNHADYGLNLAGWSSAFREYVETYMAFKICRVITGAVGYRDRLEADVKRYFHNASNKDAMDQPSVKFMPSGSFVNSRGSRNREGRYRAG